MKQSLSLIAAVLLASPLPSFAQQAAAPAKPAPAAKKAVAATPAPSKGAKSAKAASASALAPSARKAVEERTPIEDDLEMILTDEEKAIARQVFVGEMPCELGASVKLRPGRREGIFVVTTKNYRFVMHPVVSRTNAVRLEDPRRGAMWLQLGNKSMLMSQKLGQRLADECQSPEQVTFAEAMKRNPQQSILEPLRPASAASAPAVPASAAAAAASAPVAAASTPSPAKAP